MFKFNKKIQLSHVQDKIPEIKTKLLKGYHRHDVVKLLKGKENIGIELGVAEGIFSERMVASGKFKRFFGVDMYEGERHDTEQYKRALEKVGLMTNYSLLRMTFDEAYSLFEDDFFDFVYVDGYAHSGEEGGRTIFNWYKKVKVGGVIAGDDYHQKWPLVLWAVNEFAKQTGLEVMVTELTEDDNPYCRYPTWAIIKGKDSIKLEVPTDLIASGISQNARANKKRHSLAKKLKTFLKGF